VELTLDEVAKGVEKTIEFTRQDICHDCSGTGSAKGKSPARCPACGGTGQVQKAGFGGFFQMVSTCPQCRGHGEIITDPCKTCRGSGHMPRQRTLEVKIPAGVHEGQGIRIAGEGEPGQRGGPRGDLYCYVRLKPHPFLERNGNDVVANVPISFTQAALGATIDVPSLDGKRGLKIPPGTQHGDVFRIRHAGLPDLRSKERGDQLIQVSVEIPEKLTARQEELLREFARTEDRNVLPRTRSFLEKLVKYFGS
jgi:molecular chaperone DnaJ